MFVKTFARILETLPIVVICDEILPCSARILEILNLYYEEKWIFMLSICISLTSWLSCIVIACKKGFYNFIVSMKDIDRWFVWFSMKSMIFWISDEHLFNILA